jgi:hypothetical protein
MTVHVSRDNLVASSHGPALALLQLFKVQHIESDNDSDGDSDLARQDIPTVQTSGHYLS